MSATFNITLQPFLHGQQCSVCLEDFEPKGGYQQFLEEFCDYTECEFIDWRQGIESGVGYLWYQEYKLMLAWTDFPFSFCFDCKDYEMALEMEDLLKKFFLKQGTAFSASRNMRSDPP